jgi:hypothetical protein
MSLTLPGLLLGGSSIALLALLVFPLLSDETRLALLSQLRAPISALGQDLRSPAGTLIVPAMVFLLVAGIGAAASYIGGPPRAAGSHDTGPFSPPHSGSNDEMLASLTDYPRSIGAEGAASAAAPRKSLPDVNTMIERLAARLETTPNDVKGWRMLAWSYFHTGRYKQAAAALRAVQRLIRRPELVPEEAKARPKAIIGESRALRDFVGKGGDGLASDNAKSERCSREYDAQSDRWSTAWQIA